jgi:hypothetical protein
MQLPDGLSGRCKTYPLRDVKEPLGTHQMLSLRSLAFILCSAIRRACALSCAALHCSPDIINGRKRRKMATNMAAPIVQSPTNSLHLPRRSRLGAQRTLCGTRRRASAGLLHFSHANAKESVSIAVSMIGFATFSASSPFANITTPAFLAGSAITKALKTPLSPQCQIRTPFCSR